MSWCRAGGQAGRQAAGRQAAGTDSCIKDQAWPQKELPTIQDQFKYVVCVCFQTRLS